MLPHPPAPGTCHRRESSGAGATLPQSLPSQSLCWLTQVLFLPLCVCPPGTTPQLPHSFGVYRMFQEAVYHGEDS